MNQPTDDSRVIASGSGSGAPLRRPYERPRIVKGRAVEQATLIMTIGGGSGGSGGGIMSGSMM